MKSMISTVILEENAFKSETLGIKDRCIRCGARAYVKAIKGDYELLFCGHHGNEHAGKLQVDGWLIDDQTHLAFD